mmetsp:Transcript_61385/g.138527  ORF Transcript_61385/g.138527 Transcript_61385/m.138527 type:complete len:228 (+) Transcript_61385:193-876(+)
MPVYLETIPAPLQLEELIALPACGEFGLQDNTACVPKHGSTILVGPKLSEECLRVVVNEVFKVFGPNIRRPHPLQDVRECITHLPLWVICMIPGKELLHAMSKVTTIGTRHASVVDPALVEVFNKSAKQRRITTLRIDTDWAVHFGLCDTISCIEDAKSTLIALNLHVAEICLTAIHCQHNAEVIVRPWCCSEFSVFGEMRSRVAVKKCLNLRNALTHRFAAENPGG